MQQNSTHLILGASGQIGTVLTTELRKKYGASAVIASDIKIPKKESSQMGLFVQIDATSYDALQNVVQKYNVSTVYLMAAMLSANAENYPSKAWDLNMSSLFNVLNLAKDGFIKHVFWPSSIAVFARVLL